MIFFPQLLHPYLESRRDSNVIVNGIVHFTWESTQPSTLANATRKMNEIITFPFTQYLCLTVEKVIKFAWAYVTGNWNILVWTVSFLFFFHWTSSFLSHFLTIMEPHVVCSVLWHNENLGPLLYKKAKQLWRRSENTKSVRCITFKESFKHKAYLAHILSIWTCVLLQQEKLIPHPATLGAVQCFSIILWHSCYPFTVWVLVSPFLGWRHMNHIKHRAPKQNCQKGVSPHHFQRCCQPPLL